MSSRAFAEIRPDIRYAWRGPSLLVVDSGGECGSTPLSGFYFREARHLSALRFEIDGEAPFLASLGSRASNELEFVFVHPELRRFGGGGSGLSGQEGQGAPGDLPPRALDLRLRYRLRPASLEAVLVIANRSARSIDIAVSWSLEADFADLQEALSGERLQCAEVGREMEGSGVRFIYRHPRLPLETLVSASGGGPWSLEGNALATRVTLGTQQSCELRLTITPVDLERPMEPGGAERREQHLAEWEDRLCRVISPGNEHAADLVNQAMLDLGSFALLEGEEDEWLAPAAGMPLYPALFGRDALTAGWQASMLDSGEVIRSSLTRLGRLQGTRHNADRDEQPGRIIQQARLGPVPRSGIQPFDCYYGDFASPLVFLISLGQLYAWRGDKGEIEPHWDVARRILDWAREHGDRDGDGYLEYLTLSKHGPVHQGWKDSGDAMVHPDGSPVSVPTAVCEVQGYYYAAQQFMAVLSAVMGDRAGAVDLLRSARKLKARFNGDFWMEDEGFLALALDAEKKPVRTVTSNAGQCLATGIVSNDHVPQLVRRLFQPDLFSGWGIRTLSTENPAYSPLSYHRGSVWAVENATIVFGLRRYGFDDRTIELSRALLDLAGLFRGNQIPECVGGFAREEFPHPGSYPRANVPQAWNQSMFSMVTQALLGLYPAAPLGVLLVDPILPTWLPEVILRNLRVGEATLSLRFHRDEHGGSHVETLEQAGSLRVVRQPPLNDLTVGVGDRLVGLLRQRLPF